MRDDGRSQGGDGVAGSMAGMTTSPTGSGALARDDDRWAAVLRRDRQADGLFYYSVRTTRVYCPPGCGARPAPRENVRFHATSEDAEAVGFRPCKRCAPDGPARASQRALAVAKACRLIEAAD